MSERRRMSMCMHIDGFTRNAVFPRDYTNLLRDNGKTLEPAAARAWFATQKAMGRELLPVSKECGNPCQHADKGCTGFNYKDEDFKGGCPGYVITENES